MLSSALSAALLAGPAAGAWAALPPAPPPPKPAIFPGVDSFPPPAWPKEPEAPAGDPNILLIMTDDVGFGASSTFGGVIPTPTFSELAEHGLKYNDFNTAAICSPSRVALLTGRDPHSIEFGSPTASAPNAYDGYTSVLPPSAATIAEVLKERGYATAMFGKGHITPTWEMTPEGPFDRWPTGLGFEYFYGFLGGATNQFAPELVEDTTPVIPPANDPHYILDRDLADHAIGWIAEHRALAPHRPFFIYYAPGSTHAPQQAPKEWIGKFKGRFDMGWDRLRQEIYLRQKQLGIIPADAQLTPRPKEIPAWDSLSPDEKRIDERFMEVYAAQLAFCDHEIGRVIDYLRQSGQLDNTLIIYIQGDNGASAEGGPQGDLYEGSFIAHPFSPDTVAFRLHHLNEMGGPLTSELYPVGWAWAMDTPFPWFKWIASHFGATRNGMVISWPGHIRDVAGLRSQYSYIDDIVPTLLQVTGIAMPGQVHGVRQQPIDGTSLVYTFDHPNAPTRHTVQYIEMDQNVSIYKDGWVAATTPVSMPWDLIAKPHLDLDLNTRGWELYDVSKDFSEARDVAGEHPQELAELKRVFLGLGWRYKVFPVHGYIDGMADRPGLYKGRTQFEFTAGMTQLPSVPINGRSFTISADVDLDSNKDNGVLIADGGRFGGVSFYLVQGHLAFCYNSVPPWVYTIHSHGTVPAGHHILAASFAYNGAGLVSALRGAGGSLTLSVDGHEIAKGSIPHTAGVGDFSDGLDTGEDLLTPVSPDYRVPDRFGGTLHSVKISLEGASNGLPSG